MISASNSKNVNNNENKGKDKNKNSDIHNIIILRTRRAMIFIVIMEITKMVIITVMRIIMKDTNINKH